MTDRNDQDLLRLFSEGDREAFDSLFHRYAARVHATAFRLTNSWEDAEDTLQDVFIALAGHGQGIRHHRAISTWIYRTTINRAIDRLRRRRHQVTLDDNPEAVYIIAIESLRRETVRRESIERENLLCRIETLIPLLPERQAAVFVLRGFQGLPYAEIVNILNCSETTAKSHYSLACRRLRELVADLETKSVNTRRQEGAGQ